MQLNLTKLCSDYTAATVIVCGEYNQLPDATIRETIRLLSLLHQPTHGEHII